MRPRLASTALRELASRISISELAKRLGRSERTIKSALRTGRLSAALKDAVRTTWDRSERAHKAAKTREIRATKIPEIRPLPELAKKLGRPQKTVERWIKQGGAPASVRDAVRELAAGRSEIYPLDWEHGRKSRVSLAEKVALGKKLGALLEAQRTGSAEEIRRAARSWRRAKVPMRAKLTAKAWSNLVDKLGDLYGIDDVGTNSKERFKRS